MARNSLLCADVPLRNYSLTLAISERPNTSLYQVMDTPDPEVILPGELRTVATRLCDLWLSLFHFIILHPWNLLVPTKHQFVSVLRKYHLFLASLQAHQFYHLKYHSHSLHFPVYRKHSQIATRHTVQTNQKFSNLKQFLQLTNN